MICQRGAQFVGCDVDEAGLGGIHLLQNTFGAFQFGGALLQVAGHFIEGVGQCADLIATLDASPPGQVATGNGLRGMDQFEEWVGDQAGNNIPDRHYAYHGQYIQDDGVISRHGSWLDDKVQRKDDCKSAHPVVADEDGAACQSIPAFFKLEVLTGHIARPN